MRLFFKGIIAAGPGVEFVLIPHFHLEGKNIGFCFLNFKAFFSLCEPLEMITMLNINLDGPRFPTHSKN